MLSLLNLANPVLIPPFCPIFGYIYDPTFTRLFRIRPFLLHLLTPSGLGLFCSYLSTLSFDCPFNFFSWLVMAWRWCCRLSILLCRHLRAFCRRQASGPELPTTGAGYSNQPLGPPPPVEEPTPAGLVVSNCF
jgi:hypothetical protein